MTTDNGPEAISVGLPFENSDLVKPKRIYLYWDAEKTKPVLDRNGEHMYFDSIIAAIMEIAK
jgi:hypothetical protein